MIVLNFNEAKLGRLITHHVGNKIKNENLLLSLKMTDFDFEAVPHIIQYFTTSFKAHEFFKFSDIEFENSLFHAVKSMFNDPDSFILHSRDFAKKLYDVTNHSNIKSGDLNIAHISDIQLGDEMVQAIGIFKSETTVPFLKLERQDLNFNLEHENGLDLGGLDKGCLVFKTNEEEGYEVLVFDNTNGCLLYTSPSPRDATLSRMPSSA